MDKVDCKDRINRACYMYHPVICRYFEGQGSQKISRLNICLPRLNAGARIFSRVTGDPLNSGKPAGKRGGVLTRATGNFEHAATRRQPSLKDVKDWCGISIRRW